MATKTKLPVFQGKPLVEIPAVIPSADFLGGDFGKPVLEEYNGRVKSDYNNASALNVLSYDDKVAGGSNPFAVVLINQIVSQEGLRTATQADLEKILKLNALDLRGFYEDSALVLRNQDDPNKYLAKNLAEQIKARQKLRYPIMLPLNGVELVNDSDSEYGLAFKLKEDAEIIYAPQLAHKNNHKKFSEADEKGLPIFDKNGERTLYTRESGLVRLYLGRDLGLHSYGVDLAFSDSDGRVVIIRSGEATQNFIDEINKEYQKQLDELNAKREKALNILRNK